MICNLQNVTGKDKLEFYKVIIRLKTFKNKTSKCGNLMSVSVIRLSACEEKRENNLANFTSNGTLCY